MKVKLLFILLLFLPIVCADSASIKLLAVSEENGAYTGNLANLYLAISPGYGRVYIESQPLSKLDTQFSTRLARDVACEYTGANCNDYDFFYTIRANSVIVGGPSAGAAATVLTTAILSNVGLDNGTAITGTINSGGIIGPVGKLKEKIESAALNNIKRVLIPSGSIEDGIDLVEFGNLNGVEVIEISDIDEALFYFTGEKKVYAQNISINVKYEKIMKNVAELMCNRSMKILEKTLNQIYKEGKIIAEDALELEESASEFYMKGQALIKEGKYYSAASQCFGSNIRYREFNYKNQHLENKYLLAIANSTKDDLKKLDESIINEKKKYLSDLETYMIVKERIIDAEKNVEDAIQSGSLSDLSYAVERANSAHMWSKFFEMDEKKIKFNKEDLKETCINKMTEVNELYNYINLLIPDVLKNVDDDINKINEYKTNEDYELCLFKASKTKADINVVLSSMGIEEEQLDDLLRKKITAAKKVIIKENEKGIFPIIGYSYYEYADSIKDDEKYLALIYAEYGLELGNLDVYFKNKKFSLPKISFNFGEFDTKSLVYLVAGIVIGSALTLLLKRKRKKFKGAIKF